MHTTVVYCRFNKNVDRFGEADGMLISYRCEDGAATPHQVIAIHPDRDLKPILKLPGRTVGKLAPGQANTLGTRALLLDHQ